MVQAPFSNGSTNASGLSKVHHRRLSSRSLVFRAFHSGNNCEGQSKRRQHPASLWTTRYSCRHHEDRSSTSTSIRCSCHSFGDNLSLYFLFFSEQSPGPSSCLQWGVFLIFSHRDFVVIAKGRGKTKTKTKRRGRMHNLATA